MVAVPMSDDLNSRLRWPRDIPSPEDDPRQVKLRHEAADRINHLEDAMRGATIIANASGARIAELEAQLKAAREVLEEAKVCLADDCLPWLRYSSPREGIARGLIEDVVKQIVAALRAAGDPVARPASAWENELSGRVLMLEEMLRKANEALAAQPAPSASVREALERCIRICMEEASEWDSDRLQNYKNYAGHCANRISTEVLATPSPLMAAGEAAETDIMETLDRKIEHAKCMQKRAFDHGLDVQGERMHARQEAFLEVKAILMKGSVATSPAKRGYVARVMGDAPPSFQMRVRSWMMQCFSMEICRDRQERNHRFLEEALELVQAIGCTASEAHQLVDYVYGRDQGEVNQEVGGVMVTLAALCLANDIDMHQGGEVELARIFQPEIMAKIRAKQAGKPKHSPLPQAMAEPTREEIAAIVDPNPFIVVNHRHLRAIERQKIALEKADAILALKPRGGQAA